MIMDCKTFHIFFTWNLAYEYASVFELLDTNTTRPLRYQIGWQALPVLKNDVSGNKGLIIMEDNNNDEEGDTCDRKAVTEEAHKDQLHGNY